MSITISSDTTVTMLCALCLFLHAHDIAAATMSGSHSGCLGQESMGDLLIHCMAYDKRTRRLVQPGSFLGGQGMQMSLASL